MREAPGEAWQRSRLIILADMGNEPDEMQQIAHLLVCSNEFELEGLLAEAEFGHSKVIRAARDAEPPHFMTLVATGTKS